MTASGLLAQARLAWTLSAELCGDCRAYHGVWPWLRLAGLKQGLERDRPVLLPAVAAALAAGRRRVLVAGAADAGLAELVLAAGGDPALTVVDRCATPLRLTEIAVAGLDRQVTTRVADLTRDRLPPADLIVAHSVLGHIAPAARPAALGHLRDALDGGGELLLVFRLAGPPGSTEPSLGELTARLAARGLAPPADPAFAAALADLAAAPRAQHPFASLEAALAGFAAAGLAVASLQPLPAASLSRAGYLASLRPAA